MSVKNRGLGKGLDLLLKGSENKEPEDMAKVQQLALAEVFPNPSQPRQEFAEEALEELAASIRSQGVLQPILVRPGEGERSGYEIVAGERRWRAAQRAGLEVIPALIRELDDKEVLAIALIENLQREDLTPVEEALALKRIKDELELSQAELAQKVGKSRSAVANSLRLLHLADAIQKDLAAKIISPGHARAYLALEGEDAQKKAHAQVVKNDLTVRQTEALVKELQGGGAADSTKNKAGNALAEAKEFCRECKAAVENILGKGEGGLACKVSGSPDKGTITLAYATSRERERVMRILAQGAERMAGSTTSAPTIDEE